MGGSVVQCFGEPNQLEAALLLTNWALQLKANNTRALPSKLNRTPLNRYNWANVLPKKIIGMMIGMAVPLAVL